MRRTAPLLLMGQPRPRPSRVDWRFGLPVGTVDLSTRVAVKTAVHVSALPNAVVPQSRILPLRLWGENPGHLMVAYSGVSAAVGRDGSFTLRGGGGGPAGAWREMVVGRVEGRRILVSIFQCHLVGDRGPDLAPVTCKILFRGTVWARF